MAVSRPRQEFDKTLRARIARTDDGDAEADQELRHRKAVSAG